MKSVWQHAHAEKREYITPEDITAASVAGADPKELAIDVLEALGMRSVEDWSLCASITARVLKGERWDEQAGTWKR